MSPEKPDSNVQDWKTESFEVVLDGFRADCEEYPSHLRETVRALADHESLLMRELWKPLSEEDWEPQETLPLPFALTDERLAHLEEAGLSLHYLSPRVLGTVQESGWWAYHEVSAESVVNCAQVQHEPDFPIEVPHVDLFQQHLDNLDAGRPEFWSQLAVTDPDLCNGRMRLPELAEIRHLTGQLNPTGDEQYLYRSSTKPDELSTYCPATGEIAEPSWHESAENFVVPVLEGVT